jgi:hypothetical protein
MVGERLAGIANPLFSVFAVDLGERLAGWRPRAFFQLSANKTEKVANLANL